MYTATDVEGALAEVKAIADANDVGDVTLTGTQTLTNKTLTAPKINSNIYDGSGAEIIQFISAISAANHVLISNAVTTGAPSLSASGDDTNIDLNVTPKNTGRVVITQPTLSSAILGTPTSGTLTNCVGTIEAITIALSDETTDIVAGTGVMSYRMPYAFELTDVRTSLASAGVTGLTTVDVNLTGTGTILSTKLTIDSTEKTSTTAATAKVLSTTTLIDDAELTDGVGV